MRPAVAVTAVVALVALAGCLQMGVAVDVAVSDDATIDEYSVTFNLSEQLYDLASLGSRFDPDESSLERSLADNVTQRFASTGNVTTDVARSDGVASITVTVEDAVPKEDGNITVAERDGRIVYRDETFDGSGDVDPGELGGLGGFGGSGGFDDAGSDGGMAIGDGPEPSSEEDVDVAGGANVFAAGRSTTPDLPGGGGTLPVTVDVADADNLTFDAYGQVKRGDRFAYSDADGADGVPTDVAGVDGVSGIVHQDRTYFLAGVFLEGDGPPSRAPDRLRYPRETGIDEDEVVVAPEPGQPFYVGDGSTTGYEDIRVAVPDGAGTLYLGFVEARDGRPGGYDDNTGSVSVTVERYGEPGAATAADDDEPAFDTGDGLGSGGLGDGGSLGQNGSLGALDGFGGDAVAIDVTYRVEMPGRITNSTADTVEGDVARWNRTVTLRDPDNASFVAYAESEPGGSPLPGFGAAAVLAAALALAVATTRRR